MEIVACAILILGAVPADVAQDAVPGTALEESAYAEREARSPDLEEFRGGADGLILGIALIVALVVILAILIPW